MVRIDSRSSVPPHIQPPIAQVPRPIRETCNPVTAILVVSMSYLLANGATNFARLRLSADTPARFNETPVVNGNSGGSAGVLCGARSPATPARLKRARPVNRRAPDQGPAGQAVALQRLPLPQSLSEAGAINPNHIADILKGKGAITGRAQQPFPSFLVLEQVGPLLSSEISL